MKKVTLVLSSGVNVGSVSGVLIFWLHTSYGTKLTFIVKFFGEVLYHIPATSLCAKEFSKVSGFRSGIVDLSVLHFVYSVNL